MENFNLEAESSKDSHTEKRENINFTENISERLNSENFKEYIVQFPEDRRNDVIGLAVEYNILHPDGFAFSEFMKILLDKVKEAKHFDGRGAKEEITSQIFIDSVAEKMNISIPFSEYGEKVIFDYIANLCI